MVSISSEQSSFRLFGLQPLFHIDVADLEQRYLELQSTHHPDRFAAHGEMARQSATERSSDINAAYRQLRSPFDRALLLIALKGISDPLASHLPLPPDFLMDQMEQREAFEDAKILRDHEVLQRLRQEWQEQIDVLWQKLELSLDVTSDVETAALCLRQLKFLMTQMDVLEEVLFEWSC